MTDGLESTISNERIDDLLNHITKGPWATDVDGFATPYVLAFGFDTYDGTARLAHVNSNEHISHARALANAEVMSLAPTLLQEVKQLREEIKRLESELGVSDELMIVAYLDGVQVGKEEAQAEMEEYK